MKVARKSLVKITISIQYINSMKTVDRGNGIKATYGPITVDHVEPSQFNDEKWQAQVRQLVTTMYPAQRNHDSLSDGLFEPDAFGEGQDFPEKRVTWIPVPAGTSVEDVKTLLAQVPEACIQKTLSLEPILSDEQINAMSNGLSDMTMDGYKEKCVKDTNDNIVLYADAAPFYRSTKFKLTFEEDVDLRSAQFDVLQGAVSLTEAPVPETVEKQVHQDA